jgi:hypothetical protein
LSGLYIIEKNNQSCEIIVFLLEEFDLIYLPVRDETNNEIPTTKSIIFHIVHLMQLFEKAGIISKQYRETVRFVILYLNKPGRQNMDTKRTIDNSHKAFKKAE